MLLRREDPVHKPEPTIKYYRIVEHPMLPGDTHRGYQAEQISVIGDMVVERNLVDKPNLFEYAQTHLIDLVDPRNHVEPAVDFIA